MCGIVGYWNRDGRAASEGTMRRMLERIRYRGPDDQGTWAKGSGGLGHCRLSILDLSPRGHQPFVTADGQGVLTYNGEVYNFPELRKELEAEGVTFLSTTDTEVVLYALHRWGPEKAVPRFNGMFALGYYDRRSDTLWLARDRVGIKPLYLARYGQNIAFASEIKALLAHPDIPVRPDVHSLASYITYQRFEGAWTPFEDIEDVCAGSIVKITRKSIEPSVYFDVVRDVDIDRLLEISYRDPQQLTAEFESAFADSVRSHLVSDAPLAAMCSGGIDSSLTTALAKEFQPDVVAYVANLPGVKVSEGAKAQLVGRHLGIRVRQIDVEQDDLLRLWPTAIWHGDQPNCHANDMPYIRVVQACHRDGIKVVITGEGSDELFGGYSWQVKAYELWRKRRLHSRLVPNHPVFHAAGRLHPQFAPLDLPRLARDPFFRREQLDYSQDLLRQACVTDGGRRLLRHEELFRKLSRVEPVEDRAFLARAFEDWYGNLQAILHRNDRISMAASVEARVPFLENRMMDLGMHFSRRMKYHEGKTKWVVKAIGDKKLPSEIVHAKKIHFAVPMATWRHGALLLRGGVSAELFKWGAEETEAILARALKTETVIQNLVAVELWGRMFLRGESAETLGETLLRLAAKGGNGHVAKTSKSVGVSA
ncbi:MAG: asparagine synthase (glutamine-hydrolyzing) [Candidatus Omnitrophica bacterium CG11_big_fil_rev_8_21_14_0_20_63_9]|nr:MAG: asparagine synthase (glutamine-hydrolyzing) [Candidatus Omnitrophica bacterium CG11_big_fil_rev_8_21_14_0_20_63_9]